MTDSPAIRGPTGRVESLLLGLVLLVALAASVGFSALDRRAPNDHDRYYADASIPAILDYQAAQTPDDRRRILSEELLRRGDHPPLSRAPLLIVLGTFGPTRLGFRLGNLPFVALLVLGTWLLGRQIGGPWVGLLAALLVIGLPTVVVHSRKFAPPWHAAALTPLAWGLLLMALRTPGRRGWAAAVGAGLVQGLRCYSHPIVYPDVALSSSLVLAAGAVGFAGRRKLEEAWPLARVGVAVGIALLLASHPLGWEWLGPAPQYSFERYRTNKLLIMTGAPNVGDLLAAGGTLVVHWWRMHLFPTGFLLISAGLLAAIWRGARSHAGASRQGAALLAVSVAAQAPIVVLVVSRGTFTSDWQHLIPLVCVLACWGVLGPQERWTAAGRGWSVAAACHSIAVLGIPFLLGLAGPSPQQDHQWYESGASRMFAQSASGRLWNTHHIAIREPGALDRIVEETRLLPGGESPMFADLTLLDPVPVSACQVSTSGENRWGWGPPPGQSAHLGRVSSWPALFHGLGRYEPTLVTTQRSAPGLEWEEPRPGDRTSTLARSGGGPIVIRLWADLEPQSRVSWDACLPSALSPATTDGARHLMQAVLPGYRFAGSFYDLGGELVGTVDWATTESTYQSTALLFVVE